MIIFVFPGQHAASIVLVLLAVCYSVMNQIPVVYCKFVASLEEVLLAVHIGVLMDAFFTSLVMADVSLISLSSRERFIKHQTIPVQEFNSSFIG